MYAASPVPVAVGSLSPSFSPMQALASTAPESALAHYQIIRRNGAVVPFEPNKIAVALMKAFLAVHGTQGAASASVRETVEALTQQLAAAEREIAPLREELARRPPIDILRTLDVQNLLQRNAQAATAMQSLLEWQQQHATQQQ